MFEGFIHHVAVDRPPASETVVEARTRLGDKFPRGATRRMTHLGLLLGSALEGVRLGPDDAVVYATRFAETRTLEEFLGSFPTPSPALFQTSIHPSGVQQVLIGRQQPVARLWPLATGTRLVEQALLTTLLEPAPRVIVAGGEERGTWLLEQGMASDRAFAFALVFTREPKGASGSVQLERTPPQGAAVAPGQPDAATPPLADFADAVAERRPLAWRGAAGNFSLRWQ